VNVGYTDSQQVAPAVKQRFVVVMLHVIQWLIIIRSSVYAGASDAIIAKEPLS